MILRLVRNLRHFSVQNKLVLPREHEINSDISVEIRSVITSEIQCDSLAFLLRDNMNYFYDLLLAQLFYQLSQYRIQLDHTFDSMIAPISIQFIKLFTHNNGFALGRIAISAAQLQIQHQQLWDVILNKLLQNYRYLTLKQTVQLLHAMIQHESYLTHPITDKLLSIIHGHKNYYINFPDLLNKIKFILENANRLKTTDKPLEIAEAYKMIV